MTKILDRGFTLDTETNKYMGLPLYRFTPGTKVSWQSGEETRRGVVRSVDCYHVTAVVQAKGKVLESIHFNNLMVI